MTSLSKDQSALLKDVALKSFTRDRSAGVSLSDYSHFHDRKPHQILDQVQFPVAWEVVEALNLQGQTELYGEVLRKVQTCLATSICYDGKKKDSPVRVNMFEEAPVKFTGLWMPMRSRNMVTPVDELAVKVAELVSASPLGVWSWSYEQLLRFRETMSNVVSAPQSQSPAEQWWSTESMEQFEKAGKLDAYHLIHNMFDVACRNYANTRALMGRQMGKIGKTLTKAAFAVDIDEAGKARFLDVAKREFGLDEAQLRQVWEDPQEFLQQGGDPIALSAAEGWNEVNETGKTSWLAPADVDGSGFVELMIRDGKSGADLEVHANAAHPEFVGPKDRLAHAMRDSDQDRLFEGASHGDVRECAGTTGSPYIYGGGKDAITGGTLGLEQDGSGYFVLETEHGPVVTSPPSFLARHLEGLTVEEQIKVVKNWAHHWHGAAKRVFPFAVKMSKKARIAYGESFRSGVPHEVKTMAGRINRLLPWRYEKCNTMSVSASWFVDHTTGTSAKDKATLKDLLGVEWKEFNSLVFDKKKNPKGTIRRQGGGVTSFVCKINEDGGNAIALEGHSEDAHSKDLALGGVFAERGQICVQHTHDEFAQNVMEMLHMQRHYTAAWNLKGANIPEDSVTLRVHK